MHLPGTDLDTFLKAYKQPKPLQWVPQWHPPVLLALVLFAILQITYL
jgi:hypothetical protein